MVQSFLMKINWKEMKQFGDAKVILFRGLEMKQLP